MKSHGILLFSSFKSTSQLVCFFAYLLTMPHKEKGKKAQGVSHSASRQQRARKTAGRKQAHVPTMQALDKSLSEDLQVGGQAADYNGLDGLMNMLVGISSHLQATEERNAGDEGGESSHMHPEPSTAHADYGIDKTQTCHQPSP